jgi:hypothetical protein
VKLTRTELGSYRAMRIHHRVWPIQRFLETSVWPARRRVLVDIVRGGAAIGAPAYISDAGLMRITRYLAIATLYSNADTRHLAAIVG